MNVLIVGGSSDIGKKLALFLLNNGYKVIATYNRHKCELNGIDYYKLDISKENEIDKLINDVCLKYGHIDILINLASISYDDDISFIDKDNFMKVLEVNILGTFLTSKVFSRYSDGLIINMASTDGIDTFSRYSIPYSVSKAGIINLSKSMALAIDNKIVCICPNWIDSDSTNEMDRDYLTSELKRIHQDRLISIDELNKCIYEIINENIISGSVYRIDIKKGQLWKERI